MANYITASRIFLIFPILYLIADQDDKSNWIALALFIAAGVTDHLDGYIARRTSTTSSLGALLDLVADKLLIIITLFYFISHASNVLLIAPSIIIIVREIVVSSFRQLLAENKGENLVKVSLIAKSKTTLQIIALSFLIISPNFGQPFFFLTIFLFWVAAYLSIHSLYGYIKTYINFMK